MGKRLICLFLAFVMVFSFCCNCRSRAVGPAVGLGAAVVFSFLWSAGIELWRDGADGDLSPQESLESAISDLWTEFRNDGNATAPTLDRLEGEISFDTFGRAVVGHQIAVQLGDFVSWLKEKFEMKPGLTVALTDESPSGSALLFTLPTSEVEGLSGYNSVWALPVQAAPTSPVIVSFTGLNRRINVSCNPSAYMFCVYGKENIIQFVSLNPFTTILQDINDNGENVGTPIETSSSLNRLYNVSRPNNVNNFDYYRSQESFSSLYGPSFTPAVPGNGMNSFSGNDMAAISYIILAGDPVGGQADIFANIGMSVLDNVYDTLKDQSVAIDVGLTGAEEDKEGVFVGEAASAFVGGKDAALGYSAVATPVPIEGIQELYPTVEDIATDVEGLGVPSLGHALATRFPFCIPFDINYLFKSLSASPRQPVFEVDVIPQSLKTKIGITQNTGFTVDFGEARYALMLKLVRWGTLFGFILWLAFVTKRLIWTSGG